MNEGLNNYPTITNYKYKIDDISGGDLIFDEVSKDIY